MEGAHWWRRNPAPTNTQQTNAIVFFFGANKTSARRQNGQRFRRFRWWIRLREERSWRRYKPELEAKKKTFLLLVQHKLFDSASSDRLTLSEAAAAAAGGESSFLLLCGHGGFPICPSVAPPPHNFKIRQPPSASSFNCNKEFFLPALAL